MGKYPTTNIVYSGIEDKGGPTVTILDEKKNKFTIWKADYDNKELDSEAYRTLKSFNIGESFGIAYNEKEDAFTPKDGGNAGKTINFTRRTIYQILPLVTNPAAVSSAPAKESTGGANRGQPVGSDDRFWDKKAYKQCLWNYWLTKVKPDPQETNWMTNVWKIFQDIEADAERRFSPEALRPTNLSSELPTIQINEDTEALDKLAEDTPF
jgi:hypothetical protein